MTISASEHYNAAPRSPGKDSAGCRAPISSSSHSRCTRTTSSSDAAKNHIGKLTDDQDPRGRHSDGQQGCFAGTFRDTCRILHMALRVDLASSCCGRRSRGFAERACRRFCCKSEAVAQPSRGESRRPQRRWRRVVVVVLRNDRSEHSVWHRWGPDKQAVRRQEATRIFAHQSYGPPKDYEVLADLGWRDRLLWVVW